SEATATNVLSVRKRSDSNKCFICAKAKRQQQSAQPEWKSTTRFDNEFFFEIIKFYMLLFATYKEGLQKKVK
ncbi:hypothetical protein, partial [Lysinibacillus xylanilyticus]|uniref:hypothetical protein n=1 Tax=Lysinibacillus xylanilyticus TaxID=582475 RepID=UPI00381277E3